VLDALGAVLGPAAFAPSAEAVVGAAGSAGSVVGDGRELSDVGSASDGGGGGAFSLLGEVVD